MSYYDVDDDSPESVLKYLGIFNSYNAGEVGPSNYERSDFIGGIVGHSRLLISNCYDLGKVRKGAGDSYNGIVGQLSFGGYVRNHDTGVEKRIDIQNLGITKAENCYILDIPDIPNHATTLSDKDKNRINDVTPYKYCFGITRKSKNYMQSQDFANNLSEYTNNIIKNNSWYFRNRSFPGVYDYHGDYKEFYK